MLSEIVKAYIYIGAGFPDHPHRGQETITYLLAGAVDHEDFAGHKGTIEKGILTSTLVLLVSELTSRRWTPGDDRWYDTCI